jgi:DNA-binding NarL/FixJ family response regulator
MSNIPRAREELIELARSLAQIQRQLTRIIKTDLVRTSPATKTARKPVEITPVMKKKILELAGKGLGQTDIANRLGINQGRVSEVITGKR